MNAPYASKAKPMSLSLTLIKRPLMELTLESHERVAIVCSIIHRKNGWDKKQGSVDYLDGFLQVKLIS
jgi:hypothetical protein